LAPQQSRSQVDFPQRFNGRPIIFLVGPEIIAEHLAFQAVGPMADQQIWLTALARPSNVV